MLSNTGCLPTLDININDSCIIRSLKHFNKYANDDEINTIIIATTWLNNELYDGNKFIKNDPIIIGKSILNLVDILESKKDLKFNPKTKNPANKTKKRGLCTYRTKGAVGHRFI